MEWFLCDDFVFCYFGENNFQIHEFSGGDFKLRCLQMKVSWLFPSLFVPLFSLLFCSSGWLTWNAFNFPWLKILLAIGLSYTGCIILWYNLFLLLQLPQGEQLRGLSDLPREVQSSHTHRHPQIQKGLLSSAENRVIKSMPWIARTSHQFAFDPPPLRDCLSCLSPTQILWQRVLRLSHLSLSLVFRYPEEISHDRDPVNMVRGYSTPRHGSNEFL